MTRSPLILRNILAAPGFEHTISNITARGDEIAVLGDHYPQGRYYATAKAVEDLGCRRPSGLPGRSR